MSDTKPCDHCDNNAKIGVSYFDYWQQIREIATRAAVVRLLDGDDYEYLHNTVDGHQFVIYTGKALCVLMHTSNDNAYFDDFGPLSELKVTDVSTLYTQIAYAAMTADIHGQDPDPDVTVTLNYSDATGKTCYLTLPYREIVDQIDALRDKYENLNCDD